MADNHVSVRVAFEFLHKELRTNEFNSSEMLSKSYLEISVILHFKLFQNFFFNFEIKISESFCGYPGNLTTLKGFV